MDFFSFLCFWPPWGGLVICPDLFDLDLSLLLNILRRSSPAFFQKNIPWSVLGDAVGAEEQLELRRSARVRELNEEEFESEEEEFDEDEDEDEMDET
jgi:hypothetical protein